MCSTDPALGSKVRWTEKFVIARRVRSRDLRWCAAESAGERRCDVGRSDNLLGRFFGWHLFVGRWRGASWRINQAAVLDDFLNLRAVERFVFAISVFIFLRQPHGRSKRGAARDDSDFVQRLSVREKFEQQRVAGFVIRGVLFFLFAERETPTLLAPADFVAGFFQFGERDSF